MKKLSNLFMVLGLLAISSCQEDQISDSKVARITTQEELASFEVENAETVVIRGAEIHDLSVFKVSSVGSLVIQQTSAESIVLPNLREVVRDFTIENNPEMTSVRDLSSLTKVGSLIINSNKKLTDISGVSEISNITESLYVTNNMLLGADKPFEDDWNYGLFPLKYLHNQGALPAKVVIDNNHPDAPTSIETIGTCGKQDLKSYVIDSKSAVEAFEIEGDTVEDLTVKGPEITNEVLISLTAKGLRCVKGTMTLEGTKVSGTEGFFDVVKCQGSIVLKDNHPTSGKINTNGFRYYKKIGGDLVIDNCDLVFWTEGSSFASITEISGDLRMKNCSDFSSGIGFQKLKVVGGDLEIRGCNNIYSLSGMPLEKVGGSIIITDNDKFNGLAGLEAVSAIGGTLKIHADIPDYGEAGRPGWCMVKSWIEEGILADALNIDLLDYYGEAPEMDKIEACDGYNPGGMKDEPQSYFIEGAKAMERFVSVSPAEKETVIDLTFKGEDITQDMISRVQNRVAVVAGTVTWDGISAETTENFFNTIDCQGGIIVRNCAKLGGPNGFEGYKHVKGDFIVDNCPNLATPGGAGWAGHSFANLEIVEGTLRIANTSQQMAANTFSHLKQVGGNFEIVNCTGGFWDFAEMTLDSVGGDIIIENNPSLENLKGLHCLTHIGGNVVIYNNPKVPITSDWAVGYCIFRKYLNDGVISADASFRLGTDESPVDIKDVPLCY